MPKSKAKEDNDISSKGIMMILSPAKTLDLNPLPDESDLIPDSSAFTIPSCDPDRTKKVAQAMKKRSQSELGKLLSISANLAKASHQYWKDFEEDPDKRPPEETKPCIYSFSGAAYQGLKALECSRESILYLQDNLRIVDGVYGLLRPLDRMQAYRLEMATRKIFSSPKEPAKLNEYWSTAVTDQLSRELGERPKDAQILLNLASDEYAAAVDPSALQEAAPNSAFVKVVFRDQGRVIAVHAKRARGLMVRFVAESNAQTLEDVKKFDKEGYKLVNKDSDDTTIVFDRPKQEPAKKQAAKKRAAKETKAEPKKRGRKAKS